MLCVVCVPSLVYLQQCSLLLVRVVVGQDQPSSLLLFTLTQGEVKGQVGSGIWSLVEDKQMRE